MIDFLIELYFIGLFIASVVAVIGFVFNHEKLKEFNTLIVATALVVRALLSWYSVYRFFVPRKK